MIELLLPAVRSVDNLFVFLMTFDYFQVPLEHQGRVLTWGIAGAILMRGMYETCMVAVLHHKLASGTCRCEAPPSLACPVNDTGGVSL